MTDAPNLLKEARRLLTHVSPETWRELHAFLSAFNCLLTHAEEQTPLLERAEARVWELELDAAYWHKEFVRVATGKPCPALEEGFKAIMAEREAKK